MTSQVPLAGVQDGVHGLGTALPGPHTEGGVRVRVRWGGDQRRGRQQHGERHLPLRTANKRQFARWCLFVLYY